MMTEQKNHVSTKDLDDHRQSSSFAETLPMESVKIHDKPPERCRLCSTKLNEIELEVPILCSESNPCYDMNICSKCLYHLNSFTTGLHSTRIKRQVLACPCCKTDLSYIINSTLEDRDSVKALDSLLLDDETLSASILVKKYYLQQQEEDLYKSWKFSTGSNRHYFDPSLFEDNMTLFSVSELEYLSSLLTSGDEDNLAQAAQIVFNTKQQSGSKATTDKNDKSVQSQDNNNQQNDDVNDNSVEDDGETHNEEDYEEQSLEDVSHQQNHHQLDDINIKQEQQHKNGHVGLFKPVRNDIRAVFQKSSRDSTTDESKQQQLKSRREQKSNNSKFLSKFKPALAIMTDNNKQSRQEKKPATNNNNNLPLLTRMPLQVQVVSNVGRLLGRPGLTFVDEEDWEKSAIDAFKRARYNVAGKLVFAPKCRPISRNGKTDVIEQMTNPKNTNTVLHFSAFRKGEHENANTVESDDNSSCTGKRNSRIIVATTRMHDRSNGINVGDVVTHCNGERYDGSAEDLSHLLNACGQNGSLQLIFNADISVARALRMRKFF